MIAREPGVTLVRRTLSRLKGGHAGSRHGRPWQSGREGGAFYLSIGPGPRPSFGRVGVKRPPRLRFGHEGEAFPVHLESGTVRLLKLS